MLMFLRRAVLAAIVASLLLGAGGAGADAATAHSDYTTAGLHPDQKPEAPRTRIKLRAWDGVRITTREVVKEHRHFADQRAPKKRHKAALRKWKHTAARYIRLAHQDLGTVAVRPAQRIGFGWFSCAWAIASFVAQYGLPIEKVFSWVTKARQLFGDIRGIYDAVRAGYADTEIGPDAVQVLEGLLGAGSLFNDCFS